MKIIACGAADGELADVAAREEEGLDDKAVRGQGHLPSRKGKERRILLPPQHGVAEVGLKDAGDELPGERSPSP